MTKTKITLAKPTVRTVTTAQGTTQYQVVYENAVVATVDTLYAAQQTVARIVVNPANPQ